MTEKNNLFHINGLLLNCFIEVNRSYKTIPPVKAKFKENFVGTFITALYIECLFIYIVFKNFAFDLLALVAKPVGLPWAIG